MSWSEDDSALFREIADTAVPRRDEMRDVLLSLIPFAGDQAFRAIELGAGDGRLSEAILERHPRASLIAFDGSQSMRETTRARTRRFSDRISIRAFDLAALDWWDVMHGAGLVVASLCLHHLNDAKKQFLFKAIAERLAPGGALLVADMVVPGAEPSRSYAADAWDRAAHSQSSGPGMPEQLAAFIDGKWNWFRFPDSADQPSELLHQLVWLKHAGFPKVDCAWLFAGHAVFGGFK